MAGVRWNFRIQPVHDRVVSIRCITSALAHGFSQVDDHVLLGCPVAHPTGEATQRYRFCSVFVKSAQASYCFCLVWTFCPAEPSEVHNDNVSNTRCIILAPPQLHMT